MCPFGLHLPTQLQTWITWVTALEPINFFMATGYITKNVTLATTLHKPAGEANPYVRFGYVLLEIFWHTQGQVSVPMNSDPINMTHTQVKNQKNKA